MATADVRTHTHESKTRKDPVEAVKAAASDVATQAKEQAEVLRDTISDTASDSLKSMNETAALAQEQMRTAGQTATQAIQRNPGLAVAGAVGFGVLLGLAIARRN